MLQRTKNIIKIERVMTGKVNIVFFISFLFASLTVSSYQTQEDIVLSELIPASIRGDINRVHEIIKNKKARIFINAKSCYETTALMNAARYGHTAVVVELLKYGANPSLKNKYGTTALMTAAENGHIKIVAELLKHGSNPNITSNHGVTALMLAAKNGYVDIVIYLLKNGADPNIKDKSGLSALSLAQKHKHTNVIRKLEGERAKL